MIELRRILCPVDLSETSRRALDHAVVVAGWYGSHITALYVCNPIFQSPPVLTFAGVPGPLFPSDVDRRQIEEQLRGWLAPAAAAGVESDILVDDGDPSVQALLHAASLPADLIVLGTHGRGGFERLVLGSVTEKILRKARCPVLTVPPPAVATSTLPFKRLLCPVDFSESSVSGLEFAFSIAKESDAELTLLHVFEWPSQDELIVERSFDVPEFRRQCEEQARRQLNAFIPDAARSWCKPVVVLEYGKPYRAILDVAARSAVDLIVMGVRGRHALDLVLFGSTTNQVVRRASCPVLTLGR